MPPEHSDWPGQQQPQAGSSGPAPAGLAEAPAAGASAMSTLVVRTRSAEHALSAGTTYRIGRDPNSDIVVDDSRVSWRHGALRVEDDEWLLEDVGSTNGTFIGLQRIDRAPIVADCVVRLGNPDDGPILRCMPQAPAATPAVPPTPAGPAASFDAAPPFESAAAPPRQAAPPQAPPRQRGNSAPPARSLASGSEAWSRPRRLARLWWW